MRIRKHAVRDPLPGVWRLSGNLRLILFVVNTHRFQIFRFENLTAIKAADIIDAIASRYHLSFFVLAGLHTRGRYFLILFAAPRKSSPFAISGCHVMGSRGNVPRHFVL